MDIKVRLMHSGQTVIVLTPESAEEVSDLSEAREWSISGSRESQGFKPGKHLWTYRVSTKE